jgi:ubiquinone/menaquinone biosynthesis C-methylase UbiE
MQFIKENHIVLDSCCGLEHPFKFAISDKCKEARAFDLEELSFDNIKNAVAHRFGKNADFTHEMYDKVKFTQCNISELPYTDSMFDIVVCVSSLEHIDKDTILEGLHEFERVLKPAGRVILTCDYPTLMPSELIVLVENSGLLIDGEFDYSTPQNAITTNYFGGTLFCYSMVLKKI